MRLDGRGTHRVHSGKSAVRSGGLRADSVSRPADTLRQVASSAAITPDRLGTSHRTAVLCTARW